MKIHINRKALASVQDTDGNGFSVNAGDPQRVVQPGDILTIIDAEGYASRISLRIEEHAEITRVRIPRSKNDHLFLKMYPVFKIGDMVRILDQSKRNGVHADCILFQEDGIITCKEREELQSRMEENKPVRVCEIYPDGYSLGIKRKGLTGIFHPLNLELAD